VPLIVDLGFCTQSSIKSSTGNILRKNSRFGVVEVAVTRSTTNSDLKPLSGISKS